ncbi:hypothetical protein RHSIM_Rhsim06G0129200 [Rhododendron simsii]|uniref:Uncharacterized protein n=1 Tax=Rhododendron simsii TaxID=118357 RepID=A0A834GTS4_RHOSS|nr:hypothetical protein RHSIM_Rhsim06G0129200 [Rhododendron simsii]
MGDARRIHWMSWDKMTQVKGMGGLGFRDFEAFNLAVLAKQGWRLLVGDNSPFFKSTTELFSDLYLTIGEQQKRVENRIEKPDRARIRAVVSIEGHDIDGGNRSEI